MEWKDGSIKNVHIDPVLLYDYRRHLKIALGVYHKRLEWLNSESQKSFGIIREEKYVFSLFLYSFWFQFWRNSEVMHTRQTGKNVLNALKTYVLNRKTTFENLFVLENLPLYSYVFTYLEGIMSKKYRCVLEEGVGGGDLEFFIFLVLTIRNLLLESHLHFNWRWRNFILTCFNSSFSTFADVILNRKKGRSCTF